MSLHCLIVDDSAPFLDATRGLLEREGIAVVGVASTSAEALRAADELRPDLVLVDIDLGQDSGFDLVRQLDRRSSVWPSVMKPTIILISSHSEQDFAELIADSPAAGFLGKSSLSGSTVRGMILRAGGWGIAERS